MSGKKVLKICAVIFSVVLSLTLICLSVILPLYFSITVLIKPKAVVTIVQKVNYKEIIDSNKTVKSALKSYGINSSEVDEAIKSEAMGEIIEEYVPQVSDYIANFSLEGGFDTQVVKDFVNNNLNEGISVAEKITGKNISEKEVKKQLDAVIERNEKTINEAAPQVERVITTVKTVTEAPVIEKTFSVEFGIALVVVAAVIALLIIVCRLKNFRGLLWLGIDFSIAAAILAVIIAYGEKSVITLLAEGLPDIYTQLLGNTISFCNQRMGAGFSLAAFLALGFMIIYAFLRKSPEEDI